MKGLVIFYHVPFFLLILWKIITQKKCFILPWWGGTICENVKADNDEEDELDAEEPELMCNNPCCQF